MSRNQEVFICFTLFWMYTDKRQNRYNKSTNFKSTCVPTFKFRFNCPRKPVDLILRCATRLSAQRDAADNRATDRWFHHRTWWKKSSHAGRKNAISRNSDDTMFCRWLFDIIIMLFIIQITFFRAHGGEPRRVRWSQWRIYHQSLEWLILDHIFSTVFFLCFAIYNILWKRFIKFVL